ncbi:MAG: type II toxin-antitoxin system antitoxin SocA domain-containing protein, partial [Pseudolysinimonas sp.]
MSVVLSGSPAVVAVLLSAARTSGFVITRMKLAKLLYLADVRATESLGHAGSGFTWKWLNYGPYDMAIEAVEKGLHDRKIIEHDVTANYYGSPEHRLRLRFMPQIEVDAAYAEIVGAIVLEYGAHSPTTLKDLTYETPPMLAAQELNIRGVVLDLTTPRPVPDMTDRLAEFNEILRVQPPQETE